MTLSELRYLTTLAEELHFGRAAARCNISQPNLSMAIRKLEQELGLIFERKKSGISITHLGLQLVNQAKRILALSEHINQLVAADKDQLGGSFTLGTILSLGPFVFPPLLPQLRISASKLQLRFYEAHTEELRRQLRTGELDAILVSLPFSEPDVVVQELFEEPLRLLLAANHPLAAKSTVHREDIAQQLLILPSEGDCLREQILKTIPHDNTIDINNPETLRHMVAASVGVSVIPTSAAASVIYSTQYLVTRPIHQAPTRKIALAWRTSFPRHKAIDVLRNALQICCWNFTTHSADNNSSGLLVENNNW
jgi:LysR family transcriptional regulator, hydrogen peroxide-inducible genes activator